MIRNYIGTLYHRIVQTGIRLARELVARFGNKRVTEAGTVTG